MRYCQYPGCDQAAEPESIYCGEHYELVEGELQ